MMQENPENPPLRRLPFGARHAALLVAALSVATLAILFAPRPAGQDSRPAAEVARPQATLDKRTLSITRADGQTLPFTVEVARTPQEQETGLMYRTSLPENHGMLFVYDGEEIRRMWMKNTLIPLDMLFIDAAGRIVTILSRTVPESEGILESTAPSMQTLELRGGTAEAYGIREGDSAQLSDAEPGTLPTESQPAAHQPM